MIFIDNKYTKCYFSIINKAKSRVTDINQYSEKHHIIPKSLGGTNDTINLITLSAREHFICHLLLTKMVSGAFKRKMEYASHMMLVGSNRYIPSSHVYRMLKEKFRENMSIRCTGVPQSPDHILKRQALLTGKVRTADAKILYRDTKLGDKNPNSKSIVIDGIYYPTKISACRALGLTRRQLTAITS